MRSILTIFVSLFFVNNISAQDCEVLLSSIQGKYTGDCKKNKADGAGKSEGADMYEGTFKAGYPSGEGTYTYKNGDFYTGAFSKGIKEGKGEFHFRRADQPDSILRGYWKKDVYAGLYLRPFEVQNKTTGFFRLDIKPDIGQPNNTVTFVAQNTIRGNSLLGNIQAPIPEIKFFELLEGSFSREERLLRDGKQSMLVLYNVQFPLRLKLNYDSENYELLISKEGSWRVYSEISQRE